METACSACLIGKNSWPAQPCPLLFRLPRPRGPDPGLESLPLHASAANGTRVGSGRPCWAVQSLPRTQAGYQAASLETECNSRRRRRYFQQSSTPHPTSQPEQAMLRPLRNNPPRKRHIMSRAAPNPPLQCPQIPSVDGPHKLLNTAPGASDLLAPERSGASLSRSQDRPEPPTIFRRHVIQFQTVSVQITRHSARGSISRVLSRSTRV